MRIVLTGSTGQVGWALKQRLLPTALLVPDRAAADLAEPRRLAALVRAVRPEVILNAAAYTAVDQAESERERAFAVNGAAPGALARAAADCGALLVHYSTDYVFDGTKATPYTEDDPPNPINVYGASKLAGERAIQESGCRHLILRTSWVYGPRGRNFLATILRLAKERAELRVVDDQVGAPTSSIELARATLALLEADAEGLYHLTASGATSWCGFARAILERAGVSTPVRPIASVAYPTPARRPANSRLDCARVRARHGVSIGPWEEGLAGVLSRCH